jgi:hypothetical protein
MPKTFAQLEETVDDTLVNLSKNIAKFATDVAKDPFYTMVWSDKMFQTAAKYRVYQVLKALLIHYQQESTKALNAGQPFTTEDWNATLECLREEALSNAITLGRNNPSSTSVPSNLVENYLRVEWFAVVKGFGAIL